MTVKIGLSTWLAWEAPRRLVKHISGVDGWGREAWLWILVLGSFLSGPAPCSALPWCSSLGAAYHGLNLETMCQINLSFKLYVWGILSSNEKGKQFNQSRETHSIGKKNRTQIHELGYNSVGEYLPSMLKAQFDS